MQSQAEVGGLAALFDACRADLRRFLRARTGNEADSEDLATHNDPTDNIAVVVAGRRRFTLFPPDRDPATHIPAEVAGILGPVTTDTIAQTRKSLIEALQCDAGIGFDRDLREGQLG